MSISLSSEDVTFLDTYAHSHGVDSRSAVLHRAVGLLRASELGQAYEEAWQEWADGDQAELWDAAVADGTEVA